ncbi:MAG: ABC transporter permease, partial [Acidimicrobiales bacterium]
MRNVRDLVGVALAGLTSRISRTLLVLMGPLIGVAAIVASVGLTESAKGDLAATLADLGTNLIVADAAGSFGESEPTLPAEAVARAQALVLVERAAAVTDVSGVITIPYDAAADEYSAFPIPVVAADTALPAVLEVELASGRWLTDTDEATSSRAVVLGVDLADKIGYLRAERRTIQLGGIDYGVVGVLERVLLERSF